MKLLALSGSARAASTNTAMLDCFCQLAPLDIELELFHGLADLPIFSPDREGENTPALASEFISAVRQADGIIVASPEYVRGIPGGLKNAIDWLVSGDEIIAKPIVLAHASHRGLDMLASLRLVLGTVSERFNAELFVQFPLMSQTPQEVRCTLETEENASVIEAFLKDFSAYIQHTDSF